MVTSQARKRVHTYCSAALGAAILAVGLSGCFAGAIAAGSDAKPQRTASPSPAPTFEQLAGMDEVLAERDAFMKAQQLPVGGTALVATTDAQKQFIAEQSAFVLSQGGQWGPQDETISLALASDACETAILNKHEIDVELLDSHVMSSPMFKALVPADTPSEQRTRYERSVASVMIFGTKFMCPADYDPWLNAFQTRYPS